MKRILCSSLMGLVLTGSLVFNPLENGYICKANEKVDIEKSQDYEEAGKRENEEKKAQQQVDKNINKGNHVSYKQVGWKSKDGNKFYTLEDGSNATGWKEINGKRYYFEKATGAMKKGWLIQDNKRFYFDKNGVMVTGEQVIDGKIYYFSREGIAANGWTKVNEDYYYTTSYGEKVTGWKKINNKSFYFKEDGTVATGWTTIANQKYYFNEDGSIVKGLVTIGTSKYYFDNNGKMKTGYINIGSKKHYFTKTGEMNDGEGIVIEARKHIGKAYVYGATGPNSFDCSGLTQYVYKQMGMSLGRTTYAQVKQGRAVSYKDAKPGDLIFNVGSATSPGHVGIYSGNGKYVHAANPRAGIKESPVNSALAVRRIIN